VALSLGSIKARLADYSRLAVVFLYKAVDTDIGQYDLVKTAWNQAVLLSAFQVFRRESECDI